MRRGDTCFASHKFSNGQWLIATLDQCLRLPGWSPCGFLAGHLAASWLVTLRLLGWSPCGFLAGHLAASWLVTLRLPGWSPCGFLIKCF